MVPVILEALIKLYRAQMASVLRIMEVSVKTARLEGTKMKTAESQSPSIPALNRDSFICSLQISKTVPLMFIPIMIRL